MCVRVGPMCVWVCVFFTFLLFFFLTVRALCRIKIYYKIVQRRRRSRGTIQTVTKDTSLQAYIWLLTAAAPSDCVFRALGTNLLTYLLTSAAAVTCCVLPSVTYCRDLSVTVT